jgi:hypothetical protein
MFSRGPNFRKINIPSGLDSEIIKNLINKEFKVFVMKFIIAVIALVVGCVFIYHGIESDSTIKFAFKGANLELNKAYPGVILSFISLLLMLCSRQNIKIK